MSDLIQRQTSLSANLVAFCRFLRNRGFTIGPGEEADVLQAVETMAPFDNPEHFRVCLRAMLVRKQSQLEPFDTLYAQYWRELDKALDSKKAEGKAEKSKSGKSAGQQTSFDTLKSWLGGNASKEVTETATYSAHESLHSRDFSSFTEDQLREVMRLIQRIARNLAYQQSRRKERVRSGARLDLRKTLRLNMRRGGEILDLAFEKPKQKRQKIVLLCDVSKSMDLYSQFLVQFIYAFQHAYRRIETFVFSTQLHRVTDPLRSGEFQDALRELSENVPGWSGGTRIGASLHQFCESYARRLLNKQTIVLILSDGWDTGNPELLSQSMRIIHRKAAKVIWLNPLAGYTHYQPTVKGMEVAMPFIDIFASAHNIDSLKAIARWLK
ncbi:MAG: hypothetical protein DHS20C18_07180 [Saprospiraceae bacterium]|nr:MAG: hypothetical protein DHS20C18_07180 [Saprospiraceae bacterium]